MLQLYWYVVGSIASVPSHSTDSTLQQRILPLQVLTGLLRREDNAASRLPLSVLPLGAASITGKALWRHLEPQTPVPAEQLLEATMAVVRQVLRPMDVLEVTPHALPRAAVAEDASKDVLEVTPQALLLSPAAEDASKDVLEVTPQALPHSPAAEDAFEVTPNALPLSSAAEDASMDQDTEKEVMWGIGGAGGPFLTSIMHILKLSCMVQTRKLSI